MASGNSDADELCAAGATIIVNDLTDSEYVTRLITG
ncbi:hypothetical protein [Nocardia sp. NBC_00508]